MFFRIAPDRAPRRAGIGAGRKRRRKDEPQRGKARGRQVDKIVKARRRPAEVQVAFVFVADHRIRRIGRLVERAAGQAEHGEPEGRRDDAIGKILGQTLHRRARNASDIERRHVASDDERHFSASGLQALGRERLRHGGDMIVETALCRQRRGETRQNREAESVSGRQRGQTHRHGGRRRQHERERQHAGALAPGVRPVGPVERKLQTRDKGADPRDRMA